ncbi:hypothetical protein JOM56_002873 [Amanita muscaria]
MINHQPHPYIGTEKLLVIGIDVGSTTLSGVSYALLEPGKVLRIQPVTRFSGQREENSQSKIRSVVCYDQDGNVIAAGPKTDPDISPMLSETEEVRRAECLTLRLWPTHLAADKRPQLEKTWPPIEPAEDEAEDDIPPGIEGVGEGKVEGCKGSRGERDGTKEEDPSDIPSRKVVEPQPMNKRKVPRPVADDFKTPDRVFTDFLQYLFKSAKEHITETEKFLDPTFTWSAIERNTYLVLTHPNGWEGKQQSKMRDAAVAAGLVNSSTAAHQIAFVSEAGLHFCLDKNPELRQERGGLLVVDCGGGTIISAYSQTENGGFKEIVSPDCLRQSSILVTSHAQDYFNERFKDSQFGVVEVTARAFDKPEGVKCMFHDPTDRPCFAEFGCLRDNDGKYGISGGKFKVEGAQQLEVAAGLIRMLNAQIEQASSLMADSLSYREESDDVLSGLSGDIGSSLCNDLRRKSNNLNINMGLLITQVALQSRLVNACSHITNNGIPPSDETLSRTHGDMVGVGQANADAWKAQSHTYIAKSLQSESLEINRRYLAGIVLKLITAVGASLESEGALPPQYNEILEEIVEASLELHKVINEDTASGMELVTYTIPYDAEFDFSRMEDTEGEESETGSSKVICTMETGLQCRKREERGSEEEWHVAVKVKVVLASTLEAY